MITELLIRGRKLNISLIFIAKPYFPVPENYYCKTKFVLVIDTTPVSDNLLERM